ncbi:MAG: ATP-binding protein [Tannerella sp.]|nr:ATP-binding protein [Tannerella sp.]
MEKKNAENRFSEMSLIEHIEKIVEVSQNSGLKEAKLASLRPHTEVFGKFLEITHEQAIILAVLINFSNRHYTDLSDLARFWGCQNVRLMCYSNDFKVLADRKIIKILGQDDVFSGQKEDNYVVISDVIACLKKGEKYEPENYQNYTPEEAMDKLGKWFERYMESNNLRLETLNKNIEELVSGGHKIRLFREIKKLKLAEAYRTVLLFFCHKLVNESDNNLNMYELRSVLGNNHHYRKEFRRGKGQLFDYELIEFCKNDEIGDHSTFSLTEKAKKTLLADYDIEELPEQCPKDLILPESIKVKELYYNQKVQNQVAQLASLLQEENFSNVQQRLEDKGMRRGFACLFYGAPGTGKTETVYQLARQTGREILMVEISETKSMWFGESEKLIKGVFSRYKSLLGKRNLAPILLFNEADAVIGKRMENTSRSVDQTTNAIQNIILQEMENLDGIMIATTNLTDNLDHAFERRFLYKVEFEKPSVEAKQQIWLTMLPCISAEMAARLAEKFDFSGGQIENIARKCVVDSIISGNEPTFEVLTAHCQREMLAKNRAKIGFAA